MKDLDKILDFCNQKKLDAVQKLKEGNLKEKFDIHKDQEIAAKLSAYLDNEVWAYKFGQAEAFVEVAFFILNLQDDKRIEDFSEKMEKVEM